MRILIHIITLLAVLASQPALSAGTVAMCNSGDAVVMSHVDEHGAHDTSASHTQMERDHHCGITDGCKAPGHCNPVLLTASVAVSIASPQIMLTPWKPSLVQPVFPTEIKPPRV